MSYSRTNTTTQSRHSSGSRDTHRWTEEEALQLLHSVVKEMKGNLYKFEQPTALQFYANVRKNNPCLAQLNHNAMRNKMRHLRITYFKVLNIRKAIAAKQPTKYNEEMLTRMLRPRLYNLLAKVYGNSGRTLVRKALRNKYEKISLSNDDDDDDDDDDDADNNDNDADMPETIDDDDDDDLVQVVPAASEDSITDETAQLEEDLRRQLEDVSSSRKQSKSARNYGNGYGDDEMLIEHGSIVCDPSNFDTQRNGGADSDFQHSDVVAISPPHSVNQKPVVRRRRKANAIVEPVLDKSTPSAIFVDLQRTKLELERQRFEWEQQTAERRLQLEQATNDKRLAFDKWKFQQEIDLKRSEFDKDLQRIEADKQLEAMRIESEERIKKFELELSFGKA